MFANTFIEGKRSNYWENSVNRKSFFDEFAVNHGFDPLVPSNWYSISRELILQQNVYFIICLNFLKFIFSFFRYHLHKIFLKGGFSVLKHYENLNHALREVYPDIGLDPNYNFRKGTIMKL